ncbi:MAG: RibD family protein, partial [Pikeienuella sp.]
VPESGLGSRGPGGGGGCVGMGERGQALVGGIASPKGASRYINGTEALRHLHRLRARVDAVVVGVGTAIADDPQLTTRHVPGPNPVRVVIDPQGRMPDDLSMLSDGAGPVLGITRPGRRLPREVEPVPVESDGDGHIRPCDMVAALAARGLRRLLVEGGAETLARFIDAGALDELHLMVAPVVLGSGKTGLNLRPIERLEEAMRPDVRTLRFRDGDLLCLCDLASARAESGLPQAAATGS